MSYLAQMGILGWGTIEPVIFACIVGNKSILFKAAHGANKTEGCRVISKACFGKDSKFVPYDTSLVNPDDLLGYPNPKKLQEGVIEFIETPDSIWDAKAALLDELNRCNPYTAAKFFEIARARTINGRETALEFVWAACNPPDKYNTASMDPAQVSRFVVLDVPSYNDFSATEKQELLSLEDLEEPKHVDLSGLIARAKKAKVSPAQTRKIRNLAIKIGDRMCAKNLAFSSRQVRDVFKLLMNMDRVSMTFENMAKVSEESLATAVIGLIPEVSGLLRGGKDVTEVKGELTGLMKGFQLSDPIMTAATLEDLAKAPSKDLSGWAGAMTDMLMVEENYEQVGLAWNVIESRSDLDPAVYNSLRQSFAGKKAMLRVTDPKNMHASEIGTILAEELAAYGSKKVVPATRKRASRKKGNK